jgi:hypothetical protein
MKLLLLQNCLHVTAYIKAGDQAIVNGSHLREVQIEKKNSSFGEYNLITEYKAA